MTTPERRALLTAALGFAQLEWRSKLDRKLIAAQQRIERAGSFS